MYPVPRRTQAMTQATPHLQIHRLTHSLILTEELLLHIAITTTIINIQEEEEEEEHLQEEQQVLLPKNQSVWLEASSLALLRAEEVLPTEDLKETLRQRCFFRHPKAI